MEKQTVYLLYGCKRYLRLFSTFEEAEKYKEGLGFTPLEIIELEVFETALQAFQKNYNERLDALNKSYNKYCYADVKKVIPKED